MNPKPNPFLSQRPFIRRTAFCYLLFVFSLAVGFGSLSVVNPIKVSAQSSSCGLIITEIMAAPQNAGFVTSREWVEILNTSPNPIDLSNYIFWDISAPPYDDDADSGTAVQVSNLGAGVVAPGDSVILYNGVRTEQDFIDEWGSGATLIATQWPILDNGGDFIGLWTIADYNTDTASGSVSFTNACDQAIYGQSVDGRSAFLIDVSKDNSNPANWRTASDCQGTPRFTSFTSTAGDIGSPNGNVAGSCHPTITTSDPYTGTAGVSVQLDIRNTIAVTFSEPISIENDINSVRLVCAGSVIDTTTIPPLPVIDTANVVVQLNQPMTNGSTSTECTLTFNRGFVSDATSSPNAVTFPPDFELELKFTTEGATLVELSYFTVNQHTGGTTSFNWATAAEVDNAGFNLYRGTTINGPWMQINDVLIPAQGSPFEETSYAYIDDASLSEETYFYILEDADLYGKRTQHAPDTISNELSQVKAESWVIFLPAMR